MVMPVLMPGILMGMTMRVKNIFGDGAKVLRRFDGAVVDLGHDGVEGQGS